MANPNTVETDEAAMVSAVSIQGKNREEQIVNFSAMSTGQGLHFESPVIGTNVSCFTKACGLSSVVDEDQEISAAIMKREREEEVC